MNATISKHTPGPWRICVEGTDVEVINIYGGDGEVAATIHSDPVTFPQSYAVDVANARVIAVAPEMLATLEQLAIWLDGAPDPGTIPDVLANVRSVIDKATSA